jgi:hypothetical protein
MKISKNSWHYKLNKLAQTAACYDLSYGMSLCQYFWYTVFAVLKIIGTVAVGLFMLFAVSFIFYVFVLTPINSLSYLLFDLGFDTDIEVGIIILIAELVLITLAGLLAAARGEIDVFPKWFKFKTNKPKQDKESKPNLIFEYIKAKKAKVCPLVKLED